MFNLGKALLDLAHLQLNVALTLHVRRVRFIFTAIAGVDEKITQKGDRGLLSGDEQEQTLTGCDRSASEVSSRYWHLDSLWHVDQNDAFSIRI